MRQPFYYTITVALCCLFATNLYSQTTWINASNDFKWFNPVNWSAGLPANGNNAIISNPAQTEIDLTSNMVFNFDIQSQGTVIINTNGYDLEFQGDYDNNGPGILIVNDVSGSFILSSTMNNLGQIIVNGQMNIIGTGTLTNSGFVTITGSIINHNVIKNVGGLITNTPCAIMQALDGSSLIGGGFTQNGVLYQIGNAVVTIDNGLGIILNNLNQSPSPNAQCILGPLVRNLGNNSMITITPGDINNGSNADYCPNPTDFLSIHPASFDCTSAGTNVVTLTVKDGLGNTSTCTTTVIIQDNNPPSITCPPTRTINLLPGQCDTEVVFSGLSATGCGNITISQIDNTGLSSGSIFPIGETEIIFQATDVSGNTDECNFFIRVVEYQPSSAVLGCNDVVNISLTVDCTAEITPDMILEGSYGCYDDFTVEINMTGSNMVDYSFVGQTVTITATNNDTGNSCWGEGTVEDKLAPVFIKPCRDTILNCLMNTDPITIGGDVDIPTADDCSFFSIYYVDATIGGDCSLPFLSQTERIWTVTDAYGSQNSCTQIITVKNISILTNNILCPDNYEASCNETGEVNFSPDTTGYPKVEVDGTLYELSNSDASICGLTATYSDIDSLGKCGDGYRIVRRWTIVDWCEPFDYIRNPLQCIQTLDYVDHDEPIVTIPDTIFLSAEDALCTSMKILPPAIVEDCSNVEVIVITPVGPIAGNGGAIPFPGLALGNHPITYRVIDDCGNTKDKTTILNVVDDFAPIAICKTFTVASINELSIAQVFATSFDNGANDNCCLDEILARRMTDDCNIPANLTFRPFVEFCCEDVNKEHPVEVKFVDCYGNYSTCMVEVEVQDKKAPQIICPLAKDLDCGTDFTDTNLTGSAVAQDNCSVEILDYEDDVNLNCGVGMIVRTWTATDLYNQSTTCSQTISVSNSTPFTGNDITWPSDTTFNTCDSIPSVMNTGAPIFSPINSCADLAVGMMDEVFDAVSGDFCLKIHRTWTVIDWCQHQSNDPNSGGKWVYTQTIKIEDDVAPNIQDCADMVFCNFKPDCSSIGVPLSVNATDDCTSDTELTYSWVVDAFNDGVTDTGSIFSGTGSSFTNVYPNGTHKVTFFVSDDCGNTADCDYLFTIQDCSKPTLYCDDLIVENMQGGSVTLNADQFIEAGTTDNCTAFEDLQISFSSNTSETTKVFDCDDVGETELDIWVSDEAGNQDFCTVTLTLQDNMNVCGNNLVVSIGGHIKNESQDGIENVMVEVLGGNYFMQYTDGLGNFQLDNIPMGGDYEIIPLLDENPTNGVTSLDLLLIARHILGMQPLTSPYQLIAADINNSGTITTSDILALRKLILHIHDEFPDNTSWRFVADSYEFINPQNPFQEPFPEFLDLQDLSANEMSLNFMAIKIGDVNGTASPNNLIQIDDRSRYEWMVHASEQHFETGDLVKVDLTASEFDKIFGYQFTLNYDNTVLQFVELQPKEGHRLNNFGLNHIHDGHLTVSWDRLTLGTHNSMPSKMNAPLFEVTFIAQSANRLSNVLRLNSEKTTAEAFNEQGLTYQPIINFNEKASVNTKNQFQLYQNIPNPFNEKTIISFQLPEASMIELNIMDVSGKIYKKYQSFFEAGYHEIEVLAKDLPSNSILFYQLESDTDIGLKKMIISN